MLHFNPTVKTGKTNPTKKANQIITIPMTFLVHIIDMFMLKYICDKMTKTVPEPAILSMKFDIII